MPRRSKQWNAFVAGLESGYIKNGSTLALGPKPGCRFACLTSVYGRHTPKVPFISSTQLSHPHSQRSSEIQRKPLETSEGLLFSLSIYYPSFVLYFLDEEPRLSTRPSLADKLLNRFRLTNGCSASSANQGVLKQVFNFYLSSESDRSVLSELWKVLDNKEIRDSCAS